MHYNNWFRPFAQCIAASGIFVIIAGVLACEGYPFFDQLAAIDCEMGYVGLTIFLLGFAMIEWQRNRRIAPPQTSPDPD